MEYHYNDLIWSLVGWEEVDGRNSVFVEDIKILLR